VTTPTRSRTHKPRSSTRRRRRPGALRPRPVRRLPRDRGRRADSTTETYAALRLEIENWRWSGVPFFIRTGSACRSRRPSSGSSSSGRRGSASRAARRSEPARRQARPLDRRPRHRRRPPRRRGGPAPITLDMEFAERAARARRRTRCCCTPRSTATARASRGRTASRRRGGSCSRCSTRLRPCSRTARVVGPEEADRLVAGHGGWHGPGSRARASHCPGRSGR
jgi:glucose-6-phosphate 1-dehydrogenase